MLDKYGLFFNAIQIGLIYLYYLGAKKKKKHYITWIVIINLLSVELRIVRYTVVMLVLFIIQIFVIMLYPLKKSSPPK